jgi:hypothetical protein
METRGSRSKRSKRHKLANKQWIAAASTIVIGTGIAMANTSVVRADATSSNSEKSTQTEVKQETAVTSAPVTVSGDNTASDQKAEKSNTDTKEEKDLSSENASEETAVGDAADSDAEKVVAEGENTINVVSTQETVKPLAAKAPVKAKEDDEAAKSDAEKALADAKKDAGKIVDDQSTDHDSYVTGQKQTVTMENGTTLDLSSDTINSKKETSATLTLSGTSRVGDTYKILIPVAYTEQQRAIPSVPTSYDKTSILQYQDDKGQSYFEITYIFTEEANFKQSINLLRNSAVALRDVFANAGEGIYYRPYDMISGQIKVIHGTDVQSFKMNYQLPMIFTGRTDSLTLKDVSDGKIDNGDDINLSLPINLGYQDNYHDNFGTSSVKVLPNFSFDIKGPENSADWITLKSNTGTFADGYTHESSFQVDLTKQSDNVVRVHVKNVDPLTITPWNTTSKWTSNISLNVHVPKDTLKNSKDALHFEIPGFDIPLQAGKVPFKAHDKGLAFDVMKPGDNLSERITHKFHKTYQNTDAGHYITDSGG